MNIKGNIESSVESNKKGFLRVNLIACFVAFCVIVLGSYVRLSDAGLGCPDWPGCFGHIMVPDAAHELSNARLSFPDNEVHAAEAWKEMVHRYLAETLGLLILIMAFLAWRRRHDQSQQTILPYALVVLVIFQGMLGMWTVTQLLRPTIVTLHLLMGLLTLSLLFWVLLRHNKPWFDKIKNIEVARPINLLARFAVIVLALQIFLGGWTSTNYVALYCPDFPTCQGVWLPDTNFGEAFQFFRDPSVNYEGGTLSLEAGVTVHFLHRVGAVITTLVISALAFLIIFKVNSAVLRRQSILLLFFLGTQVSLGIANVLLVLPIPIAVSHNAIAAALLLTLLLINYSLNPKNIASVTSSSRVPSRDLSGATSPGGLT